MGARQQRTALARPVGEGVVDEGEEEDLSLPVLHFGGITIVRQQRLAESAHQSRVYQKRRGDARDYQDRPCLFLAPVSGLLERRNPSHQPHGAPIGEWLCLGLWF